MQLSDFKVFVPSTMYKDKDFTGYDISVYSYMSIFLFNKLYGMDYLYPGNISFIMNHELPTTSQKKRIKNSLEKIINLNYVDGGVGEDGGYYIDVKCFPKLKGNYAVLPIMKIDNILALNYKFKYDLVKLYALIIGSRRYDGAKRTYSEMTIDWFAEKIGVSAQTITKYIKILEEQECICVIRSGVVKENNIYGAFEDKDMLSVLVPFQAEKMNNNRSLMQKYYWVQRGKTYPQEEMIQIRNYIEKKNKKHAALQKEYPDGDYPQYDLSVLS